MDKNIYLDMTERNAMYNCKSKIYDEIWNLMDAHGKWCGKEVLESILDGLTENGYFD